MRLARYRGTYWALAHREPLPLVCGFMTWFVREARQPGHKPLFALGGWARGVPRDDLGRQYGSGRGGVFEPGFNGGEGGEFENVVKTGSKVLDFGRLLWYTNYCLEEPGRPASQPRGADRGVAKGESLARKAVGGVGQGSGRDPMTRGRNPE